MYPRISQSADVGRILPRIKEVQLKCPHCEAVINRVILKEVDGSVPFTSNTWKCVAYGCPSCQKAISVQIDPVALRTEILAGVKKLLGR